MAVDLACEVYKKTGTFAKQEQNEIVSQMRRSATSIAGNIAAGAARQSSKEFVQYLHTALGSTSELDTQLEIAIRASLADPAELQKLRESAARVNQTLRGLAKSVRKRPEGP